MMMLVYMYKRHSQTLIIKHLNLHTLKNLCSTTPIFRSYTTKQITPTNLDSTDFKISFLKNKCGLSGKPLVRASKYVDFDSSHQIPDSVLELLRTFGFPQPSITKIISHDPRILKEFHPEKFIKPKLDFLLSMDLSQAEVVTMVTKNPGILLRSLNDHLIPSFNQLNSVIGSYRNPVAVLKCNPRLLTDYKKEYFLLNSEFLLKVGMPHSQFLKFLTSYYPVLGKPHDKLRNAVLKVKDMGFDLSSSYFLSAINTLCYVTDSTWEARCVLFRSFGFSDHEIILMFRKLPKIMCYNEKNIIEKMEFFVNKLQWTPSRLSFNPAVLSYSLQKRTIPRCSVLQVLISKNISSESYMLSTIVAMPQRKFLEEFVNSHKDEVPEVLEAYQGKLRFDEYIFKQKGQQNLESS